MEKLSGWGRYPKIKTTQLFPNSESELIDILRRNKSFIARGNGRSYGDSAINEDLTITMTRMNKIIKWDQATGELVAESGALIADIVDIFLPKGWFPFVTPGTKFITLGGAIAADVHGKNHHLDGSFGNHVNWIEIINDDNDIVRCSKSENSDLFNWTIGGMGLTGIIIRCSLQLKKVESGWIKQRTITNQNFDDTLQSFYDHIDSTYSVAWIDCLATGKSFGRSILMIGEHATFEEIKNKPLIFPKRNKQKISFFFNAPSMLLNNLTVSLFNKLYFNINKNKSSTYVNWDSYFYPLDSIKNWNRMYGKKGFFQFQCILSKEKSIEGYKKLLSIIQKKSSGSFLAVLKNFGPGNGYLSFPKEGLTLALDFKATSKNLRVAKELIDVTNNYGGYIYLAKDSILNQDQFQIQMKKNSKKIFSKYRNNKIKSQQSIRINL